MIREHRNEIVAAGDVKNPLIVEDQRVERGGVIVETDAGTIDSKISTAIARSAACDSKRRRDRARRGGHVTLARPSQLAAVTDGNDCLLRRTVPRSVPRRRFGAAIREGAPGHRRRHRKSRAEYGCRRDVLDFIQTQRGAGAGRSRRFPRQQSADDAAGRAEGIGAGSESLRIGDPLQIGVDLGLLGRVLGRPRAVRSTARARSSPSSARSRSPHSAAALSRRRVTEPLGMGVRAIDGLLTCGKGQRVGIFAG